MVDNKKPIEKAKKERTPAQIAAFEKARANRLKNIEDRKKTKEGTTKRCFPKWLDEMLRKKYRLF